MEPHIKSYTAVRRLSIEHKGLFHYLDWRFAFLGTYFSIDKNLANWAEWVGISRVDESLYFPLILPVDWLSVGMNWLSTLLIKVAFTFPFDTVSSDEGLGSSLYKGPALSGDSLPGN